MEQWEIDLRKKLEEELPNGIYNIGTKDFVCHTGKQGKINFEVLLHKKITDYLTEVNERFDINDNLSQ